MLSSHFGFQHKAAEAEPSTGHAECGTGQGSPKASLQRCHRFSFLLIKMRSLLEIILVVYLSWDTYVYMQVGKPVIHKPTRQTSQRQATLSYEGGVCQLVLTSFSSQRMKGGTGQTHIWLWFLFPRAGSLTHSTVVGTVGLTLQILPTGWDLMMLQKSWKPSSSSWKVAR